MLTGGSTGSSCSSADRPPVLSVIGLSGNIQDKEVERFPPGDERDTTPNGWDASRDGGSIKTLEIEIL